MTHHQSESAGLPENSNRSSNRLVHETSPYLLQHAYNPVDWYPWGDEAFEAARQQNKPVFLSIGYSACHWCHVMEHESFEDTGIAQLMNELFINIKVDREERPDLDQIYMASVQLITRRGGWPMSVFLDHSRTPFYGGTYWPPVSRHGMPGFTDILKRVNEYWTHKREECLQSGREILEAISSMETDQGEEVPLSEQTLIEAGKKLLRSADHQHGGFGGAPKFPHTMDIRVLLRYAHLSADPAAIRQVRVTLDKMCQGGIYDHLGGGFARYSTDEFWLVPHFEKMLYDNALLVSTYLEGWQLTGDQHYKEVVVETLDYILREMTSPEGGFYSTQDADSEGVEGKFYVWSEEEIISQLGQEDARVFNYVYDVAAGGNWEGETILNRPKSWEEICRVLGMSRDELNVILARSRKTLYAVRATRIWPGRDDKILTSWNGLMITAMAQAGRYLAEPRYIQAAERAAQFLLSTMRDTTGRLLHGYKDGRARFNGYLDDYAALTEGLLELFQATGHSHYLTSAEELLARMQDQFSDPAGGAYFYTSRDREELILRNKDTQDNATPSGNTLAATVLMKASHLTTQETYRQQGVHILKAISQGMTQYPLAYGQGLLALTYSLPQVQTLVLCPGQNAADNLSLEHHLGSQFKPFTLMIKNMEPSPTTAILMGKTSLHQEPTCYLCQQHSCREPIVGKEQILTL